MMENETQLWAWFLFGGVLSAQRAKSLLAEWEQTGVSLSDALKQPSAHAAQLRLTVQEAARLRVPATLPPVSAIRWNESLYPYGLHNLPFKLRPALLFFSGDANLLMRPIIFLAMDALAENVRDMLQEVIGMALGENMLFAAIHGSPQATLLLEEMADSEGEAMLLARQGLDCVTLSEQEERLLHSGRVLIVTPFPPGSQANPAWDPILAQVATGMAARSIHCTQTSLPTQTPSALTTLLIDTAAGAQARPDGIHVAGHAAEALAWLLDIPTLVPAATAPQEPAELAPLAPEPPLPPEEALQILEKGGQVPAVLRERLRGKRS